MDDLKKLVIDLTPEIDEKRQMQSRAEILLTALKKNTESDVSKLQIPRGLIQIVRGKPPFTGFKNTITNTIAAVSKSVLAQRIYTQVIEKDATLSQAFIVSPLLPSYKNIHNIDAVSKNVLTNFLKPAYAREEDIMVIMECLHPYRLIPKQFHVCMWRDYKQTTELYNQLPRIIAWLEKQPEQKPILFIGPGSQLFKGKLYEYAGKSVLKHYFQYCDDIAESQLHILVQSAHTFVCIPKANRFESIEAELQHVPVHTIT